MFRGNQIQYFCLSVPILFNGNVAKSKVAKLESQSWEQQKQNEEEKLEHYLNQKKNEVTKYQEAINYYEQHGKKLSEEINKVVFSSIR